MEFQKGDVVTLRSGGPTMTVRKMDPMILGNQIVRCVWFNRAEKREAGFAYELLEQYQPGNASAENR
jgi:uncharacterized protein YodC (DUF2158 family)